MGINKSNTELRYMSRNQLKGSWLIPIIVCAIYSLVFTILNDDYSWFGLTAVNFGGGMYTWSANIGENVYHWSGFHMNLGWIISMILSGPFMLGLTQYFIKFSRNDPQPVESLFNGFKKFTPSLVLYLLISIYTFLWTLLLIIPGIIAALSYSQAFYIMNDNPNISAMEAIDISKKMMDGHKLRYLVLNLSFIGWFILACLSFGIGFLWFNPYYHLTMANFYEDLKLSTSYSL